MDQMWFTWWDMIMFETNNCCVDIIKNFPNLMQKSKLDTKNKNNLEVPKSGTWSSKSGKVLFWASKSGTVPPKVGRLTGMDHMQTLTCMCM